MPLVTMLHHECSPGKSAHQDYILHASCLLFWSVSTPGYLNTSLGVTHQVWIHPALKYYAALRWLAGCGMALLGESIILSQDLATSQVPGIAGVNSPFTITLPMETWLASDLSKILCLPAACYLALYVMQ